MSNKIKKKINKEKISLVLDKILKKGTNENFINRAVVVQAAVEVFKEYLEEKGVKISDTYFDLSQILLERFDIANIKLGNNIVIDIRAIAGEDYPQMCIPREHFQKEIQPDVYVGIRVDEVFKEAEIIGFIKADDISQIQGNKHYFVVETDELASIEGIESAIGSIPKRNKTFLAIDHEKTAGMFIPFIDNSLSEDDQNYLLEHISGCYECAKRFNFLISLENELKEEKEKLFLEEDYTLRLLTNDPVFEKGEEVEISIKEEIQAEEIKEEVFPEIEKNVPEEEAFKETDVEQYSISDGVFVEEEPEEENSQAKGTHTPRDWADELAANLKANKEESLRQEEHLDKTDLRELEPDDRKLKDLGDIDLSQGPEINLEEKSTQEFQEPEEEGVIELEGPEPEEKEEQAKPDGKKEKPAPDSSEPIKSEEQELQLEDILESLDEVEVLQGEEDIDNLLSFFEPEQILNSEQVFDLKLEAEQPNQEQVFEAPSEQQEFATENLQPSVEEKQESPSAIEEKLPDKTKDRGDIKVQKGDKMGYTSVLETKKSENDNLNFIVEEDLVAAEVIPSEDLMNIFDIDVAEIKSEKTDEKKNLKVILKRLVEDKSVIAFTVAISLSTTVLFLYLGQVNKQVQMAGTNTGENQNNVQKEKEIKIDIKRSREPLKTYTRQIVKVVKPQVEEEKEKTAQKEDVKVAKKEKTGVPEEIQIKNISWELPAGIARDTKVKDYFLEVGEKLKVELAKDLNILGANVQNSSINIYSELNSSGYIITAKIAESSGIEKIDNICLDNFRKIIKMYKIPGSSLKQDKIKFILMIRT